MKNITLEDGNTTKTSQRPARQFIMDSTIPLPLNTYIIVLCLHPLHHCLTNVSIHYTIISQYLYHCFLNVYIHYTIISWYYLYHCLSESFIFTTLSLNIYMYTIVSLMCSSTTSLYFHPLHHCLSHYLSVHYITLSIEPLVPVVILYTTCILIYIAPPNVPTNFTATTMKISSTSGPKGPVSVSRPQPPPTVNKPQPPPC